ncbi:ferredoxin [Streptomyces yunnanensis]|uniref:Ferredoxin n=1 Tax=Streptomyces yunnanensis TaxID=156453 RepID=A0A9X8QYN0_9ACTN|nr:MULTISPECIES: ferredoxin [Streptomyces]SHN10274.1 ferredoxin [Streptomyces yunnanensis]
MSAVAWKVEIDPGLCIASGSCPAIAPELFALDGPRARALREEIPEDERALDAAEVCPAMAITVRDASGQVIGPLS